MLSVAQILNTRDRITTRALSMNGYASCGAYPYGTTFKPAGASVTKESQRHQGEWTLA